YTSCPPAALDAQGIRGPVVVNGHVPVEEALRLQQSADVLFLPLAFQSPYPQIIRTSAPGKLGEYLASGRPILAHAPADSFVSWYLREHGCGLVVDREDPDALAAAIARLDAEEGLRRELAARALERVRADFALAAARRAV